MTPHLNKSSTPTKQWEIWPQVDGAGLTLYVCPLCGAAVAAPEKHVDYHRQRNEEIPELDPHVFWGLKS